MRPERHRWTLRAPTSPRNRPGERVRPHSGFIVGHHQPALLSHSRRPRPAARPPRATTGPTERPERPQVHGGRAGGRWRVVVVVNAAARPPSLMLIPSPPPSPSAGRTGKHARDARQEPHRWPRRAGQSRLLPRPGRPKVGRGLGAHPARLRPARYVLRTRCAVGGVVGDLLPSGAGEMAVTTTTLHHHPQSLDLRRVDRDDAGLA